MELVRLLFFVVFLPFSFSDSSVANLEYKYEGCYQDGEKRRLRSFMKDFGEYLFPEECVSLCKQYGYSFAGLQYSTQCFCGDSDLSPFDKRRDEECSHKCSGDKTKLCGGNYKNTVYNTGVETVASVANLDYKYEGCYQDGKIRRLDSFMKDFGENLVPEECVSTCKRYGYRFAGLQYRTQCFCGDSDLSPVDKRPDSDCSMKCSGDISKICGGLWKNTVYSTGIERVVASVANLDYKYEGCYQDGEKRRLSSFMKDFGENLLPDECVNLCKYYGYRFAGLQYRTQCFCGDSDLSPYDRRLDEECSHKCSGDITKLCGGNYKNTVYNTGIETVASVANIDYKYEGCYQDGQIRRLSSFTKDFGENLVPEECVSLCKRYGYRFAGLQYRTQCFCGDSDLSPVDRRLDSECSIKCSGDFSKICGGFWKNTVYSTGIEGTASVAETEHPYLGCYKDSEFKRKLEGQFKDFGQNNTPQKCVDFCSEGGYKYAGMQYSSQCFCGDQTPADKDKVEDKQCASRCSGETSFFCGAGWRNTVYDLQTSEASVEQIGDQYLGCYIDVIDNRKLDGKLQKFGTEAKPKMCIDFCYEESFIYAGLQDSQECFCGNDEPILQDKRNESECNARCSGENSKICGGKFRNTIYKTNLPSEISSTKLKSCAMSITSVNGKPTCKEQVIFFDDFSEPSLSDKWNCVVKIPVEPDSEFVIYNRDPANLYIEDGKLVIKPTVLNDSYILRGHAKLEGCTGDNDSGECEHQARIYLILPPAQSARLNTKNSFSFRYGRVDIRAKLPKGDWLAPDLLLENKENTYGPHYSSGRIRIAMSRGNDDLHIRDEDISCRSLDVGVVMGVEDVIKEYMSEIINSECWNDKFHVYSLIWTHNNISFYVDGEHTASLLRPDQGRLSDVVGFSNEISTLWSVGSNIAPFDSDFYLTVGVSAGGVRNFPDSAINAGKDKPWKNLETKRTLNFWKARKDWEPTWSDASALQIDYIKVTAI